MVEPLLTSIIDLDSIVTFEVGDAKKVQKLAALAKQAWGFCQIPVVIQKQWDEYELVWGTEQVAAAKLLAQAGVSPIELLAGWRKQKSRRRT